MAKQIHEDPKIVAAAERQMQVRAIAAEIGDRVERRHRIAQPLERAVQFVTISREAGAGGSEIGHSVGERLGWTVYDKNLLDRMAEQFNVSRGMLDLVDETPTNWVYDVLGTWMDRKIVPHEKYVTYLSRILSEVAKQGCAVFIGRAAQFLLPRAELLAVRIVASEKYRIRQIVVKKGVSEGAAQRYVHEVDQGRREFVARFFHRDIADPHNYDLVVNVDRCGPQGAVDEIVAAVRSLNVPQHASPV